MKIQGYHAARNQSRRSNRKIADVALDSGFVDLSYFNRAFRRRFDPTPSGMRERALRDGE